MSETDKIKSWKNHTRSTLMGEKVELLSTSKECWFRPKKLSNAAIDEISEMQREFFRDGRAKSLKRYSAVLEKLQNDELLKKDMTAEQLAEFNPSVSQDDMMELMGDIPALPTDVRTRMQRTMLQSGVGEHNFGDDAGKLVGDGKNFDDKTINEILEWGVLADEMCKAIQEHSAPLARKSKENSSP